MNREEWASLFLYVPAGGRKIPLNNWKWSGNCPDDVDPRSEENPWVLTYEQTRDPEVIRKIEERYDYWDREWVRVGVVDGYEWVDIDIDIEGHDVTIEDPDKVGFEEELVSVMRTGGGWHLELVIEEGVLPVRGRKVPGIDYQGTLDGMTGVAGDPFHGSDYYEFKSGGEVVTDRYQMTLNPGAAVNHDGEPLMRAVDEGDRPDGSPGTIADLSSDLPVDMGDVLPDASPGVRRSHPVHGSSTGANFGVDEGLDTWNCYSGRHDHDCGNVTGNAYHFIAMQEGILECGEWMGEGREAWGGKRDEIAEACERRGIPLPPGWGEYRAELDPIDRMRRGGDEELLREIRGEFTRQCRLAVDRGVNGHLVGPKAVGKTYNAVRLGEHAPVTIIAPTKQKYEEILGEADQAGLDALRLPSFPEHSDLYDDWESAYRRGAYPREIYNWEERDVGRDEYKRRQDLDFGDYDVLVGSPAHAFVRSVVENRVVIFDDSDLDAYRDTFTEDVKSEVNAVLTAVDSEFGNWRQLSRSGDWATVEAEMAAHLDRTVNSGGSVWEALDEATGGDGGVDRRAFLAQIPEVSLDAVDWIRALTGDLHSSGAYEDRGMRLVAAGEHRVLVRAPDLAPAEQVFTMGAWPAVDELEAMFEDMGVDYDGMYGTARHGDMEVALNRFVVQTSSAVHNKSRRGDGRENPERIGAIRRGLRSLGRELGVDEDPAVFSTLAETTHIEDAVNYGQLTGTNEFGGRHLAIAGASQHFGDHYVNIRAAYAGHAPEEPVRDGPFDSGRWESDVHARIDRRMRQGGLYEAVTRVGREDTDLTVVAVDSSAVPEWLQVVDQSDRVRRLPGSAEALLDYASEAGGAFQVKDADGVGAADELDYSAVQLYEEVERLLDAGLLVELDESGKWGASRYEAPDEPVNRDILGLKRAELTGRRFSGAANPDWDVEELNPGVDSAIADLETVVEPAVDDAGYVKTSPDGAVEAAETATLRQSGLAGTAVPVPQGGGNAPDDTPAPGEQARFPGGWTEAGGD